MKEIKFTKLKTLDGYNVEVDDAVIGRFAPFSPKFSFENLIWIPKIKRVGIPGGYVRTYVDKKLTKVYHGNGFVIDGPKRVLMLGDDEIILSKMEFNFMYFLASRLGECLTREEFEVEIWGARQYTNIVDVHLKNLRNKIKHKVDIETLRGVGYRLR